MELTAAVRAVRGSNACGRLRRQGLVPAVAYGKAMEPIALQVSARELRAMLGPTGEAHHLINLKVQRNGSEETLTVLVKEVQRDPVTHTPLAVDFQRVSLTEKVTTTVPLVTHGAPVGAREGGILEQTVHEIEVSCLPQDIPSELTIDVGGLGITESLHVRDITPPENVEILTDAGSTIIIVHPPRVIEEAPPAPTEEEAAEPEVIQAKGKKEEEDEEEQQQA